MTAAFRSGQVALSVIALLGSQSFVARASAAGLPKPDHIVVVIEENHSYNEILRRDTVTGNYLPNAPYLQSLAGSGASFINAFGVTRPSQPNYLYLFSGSRQDEFTDNRPMGVPFTSANLGAELRSVGLSFATFSESLPSVGFDGESSTATPGLNEYQRKHNPAVNWQNDTSPTANQLPSSLNRPFTDFPSGVNPDFSSLPTISFVVPNEQHDMHDGTIREADDWLRDNLNAYRQWAQSNNSLLVVTWDEAGEDPATLTDPILVADAAMNHIPFIITGQGVIPGEYTQQIDHRNVLRTFEDMYGLGHSGEAAAASPISGAAFVPEPGILSTISGIALLHVSRRRRR